MESLELEEIKENFKKSLSFENPVSRFEALIEVARQTDGSGLPSFMKERIQKRIFEKQQEASGLRAVTIKGLLD